MKKVVQDLTSGGIDWQREKWQSGLGSKFIHQGEKNAAKYADEVIVLSKGVQDYFKETYGRETHFIPNGVNRPQIREAKLITDHFGLEKDSYILFLGRLVPEKGIRYLVEAFKNVKTDKKLVIAGGSSDTDSFMEELRELAKGDDRVLFTGFVQGAMLDELYSNAYIYTLPSDLEGIQNSIDREELYVLADGDEVAACVIANDEKVDGYSDAPWQIDSDEVIVLHVLAVHPDRRRKGLAQRLVENVIEQARNAGKKALRLDVIENNTSAEKLYQELGFRYIQTKTLYYDVVGEMTFKLYELVL